VRSQVGSGLIPEGRKRPYETNPEPKGHTSSTRDGGTRRRLTASIAHKGGWVWSRRRGGGALSERADGIQPHKQREASRGHKPDKQRRPRKRCGAGMPRCEHMPLALVPPLDGPQAQESEAGCRYAR